MISYCKKCLLPIDYLNIKIDKDGICNFCNSFTPPNFLGTEKLLEDIKEPLRLNSSEKYDCVVGFSGGRDSTYVLWYIVKVLKLRPLAVFSDDLFIPEIALRNIKQVCQILAVDLRHIKHDYLKKCLKHHLKAWIRRPVAESLMFINVGERLGYETLVEQEAIKEGVHLIFGGRTPIQAAEKYKTDVMKISHKGGIISWIFGYIKQIVLNPFLVLNPFCLKIQYKEFVNKKWKEKLKKKYKLTIIHPFFNYIQWNERDVENVLINELKWELPFGAKNSARFGCEVDTLRQFLFYRTLGYNDTNVDLSYLIRDGQISREKAAEKLEYSISFAESNVRDILIKAGIDPDDFISKLNKKYPLKSFSILK